MPTNGLGDDTAALLAGQGSGPGTGLLWARRGAGLEDGLSMNNRTIVAPGIKTRGDGAAWTGLTAGVGVGAISGAGISASSFA